MAERHSIVVFVRGGKVLRVAFCECCPPVSVEVRTYEIHGAASRESVESIEPALPLEFGNGRWQDDEGTYRPEFYAPEDG